jgi:hypothetical protein
MPARARLAAQMNRLAVHCSALTVCVIRLTTERRLRPDRWIVYGDFFVSPSDVSMSRPAVAECCSWCRKSVRFGVAVCKTLSNGVGHMIRILLTVVVLGAVGSFAGLAMAQVKQGEASGSGESSHCAHRKVMPPDPRDGCAASPTQSPGARSGIGPGSAVGLGIGTGQGIGPGGGQGNVRR